MKAIRLKSRTGDDITLVDKMRELEIFKPPHNEEETYNLDRLEFTDKFHEAMNEILNRLALDPGNLHMSV